MLSAKGEVDRHLYARVEASIQSSLLHDQNLGSGLKLRYKSHVGVASARAPWPVVARFHLGW